MKTRKFGYSAAFVALAAISMSVACADQPRQKCITGRGLFAARYTKTAGTADACNLKGALFGIQSYNAEGENGAPNLDAVSIAIQPTYPAKAADLAGVDRPALFFATGKFTSAEPDDSDTCKVQMDPNPPTFTVSRVSSSDTDLVALDPDIEPVDDTAPTGPQFCAGNGDLATPEHSEKYEWSNMVFYVTSSATGTQFKAHLVYTQDKDVCEFDVQAVYPAVSCGTPVGARPSPDNNIDPTNNPTCRATTMTPTTAAVDPCGPTSATDFIYGNPDGSYINPDFKTVCEPFEDVDLEGDLAHASTQPTQFVCLPVAGKFPSLR